MAENPDETQDEGKEAAPEAEAGAAEAEITPDTESAGQAAIDAMGLGEAAGPVSVSELTTPAASTRGAIHGNNAVNEVKVELSVVLGRATMPIHQLLKMGRGAVIELGSSVDDDAIIYANNRMIARGQVVVVGENIAVSITDTVQITDN